MNIWRKDRTYSKLDGWVRAAIMLLLLISPGWISATAAPDGTEVGGEIKTNTTWTVANSPYIVTANIQVLEGVTLTIQPGVVVEFTAGKKILVLGTLNAQGTPTNLITFTSNLPEPQPGDWGDIVFRTDNAASKAPIDSEAAASNILKHCIVEYGGSLGKGAILVSQDSLLLDSCTVRYSNSGGVRATGTSSLPVVISNNTIHHNTATGDGGGIYAVESSVVGNTVTHNSGTGFGGGIFAVNSTVGGNTLLHNAAFLGGGIYAQASTVNGNIASQNLAFRGGGMYSDASTVSGNSFTANRADERGAGVYLLGASVFQFNTVVGNANRLNTGIFGGVEINGTPYFHYNNLYQNTPYDVVLVSSSDLSGENNYWGTTNTGEILDHIYDFFDDNTRGLLLFSPPLANADPNAPVPPPLNLQADFTDSAVTLSWDPVPGSTASYSYRVYYDHDAAGPPYEGTGLTQGDSPIAVGTATSTSLDGDHMRRYYITVTAVDGLGRESWYTNVVDDLEKVYSPVILR